MVGGNWVRLMGATATLVVCVTACSSDGVSEDDRKAWQTWSQSLVSVVCSQQKECGGDEHTCLEVGGAAADGAQCDAAVEYYLANRAALEACIDDYPDDCSTLYEACPPLKGHDFEELCPTK